MTSPLGSLIDHDPKDRDYAAEITTASTRQNVEQCTSVATHWYPIVRSEIPFEYSSAPHVGSGETGSASIGTDFAQKKAFQEYIFMVSRVLDLLQEEEDLEDEYGAEMPTEYALRTVLELLSKAYNEFQTAFSRAAVSVSFEGGIRIQWMYPHSSMRLVVSGSPDEDGYIYFENGDNYDTESVSAQNLADRISWLQRNCRNAETN